MKNVSPSTDSEIETLPREAARGDVRAVQCLMEKHRSRLRNPLAFDEIAAILEIGLGAAKMRHLGAVDRLRGMLEELGAEPSVSW